MKSEDGLFRPGFQAGALASPHAVPFVSVSDERPFQRLEDRLAGLPLDRTLHDGVPPWLNRPLRSWLENVLDDKVAFEVALRLHFALREQDDSYISRLQYCADDHLLATIDAVLQLHEGWERDDPWSRGPSFWHDLSFLGNILTYGSSMYKVDYMGHHLVRRVDETVQKAADQVVKKAPNTAAGHLREAWVAAYGLNPKPDTVFNEAIRAVEEVACPLVEHKKAAKGVATLGTVIGELENSPHKWELVLPAKNAQPRDVESVVAMMKTLWDAQRSRHGGGPNSRRQTQEEAEAAVHLAVLLVQWLSIGVLRRKP